MIKVLIVDDSEIVHQILTKVIKTKSNDIEVVGNAYNGEEAINFLKSNSPDIIIMDIEMPVMDGLTSTRKIMEEKPTPIIVFSAATKKIADLVMKALEAGAVDVVEKPENLSGENIENFIEKNIINKIKIFYGFKVIRRLNPSTLKKLSDEKDRLQRIVTEKKSEITKKYKFTLCWYRIINRRTTNPKKTLFSDRETFLPDNSCSTYSTQFYRKFEGLVKIIYKM